MIDNNHQLSQRTSLDFGEVGKLGPNLQGDIDITPVAHGGAGLPPPVHPAHSPVSDGGQALRSDSIAQIDRYFSLTAVGRPI